MDIENEPNLKLREKAIGVVSSVNCKIKDLERESANKGKSDHAFSLHTNMMVEEIERYLPQFKQSPTLFQAFANALIKVINVFISIFTNKKIEMNQDKQNKTYSNMVNTQQKIKKAFFEIRQSAQTAEVQTSNSRAAGQGRMRI